MSYNSIMNLRKKLLQAFFLLAYFVIPLIMFAQPVTSTPGPCDTSGKICDPLAGSSIKDIPTLIHTLLTGILRIGLPIVALAIIYSGFLFVAARGNSEKLSKAKDTLLYTLIGAAILLGSWAIAEMIQQTVTSL